MATLTDPIYYVGGEIETGTQYRRVGIVNTSGTRAIVRYTLTIDADESANEMKIKINTSGCTAAIQWRDYDSMGSYNRITDIMDEKTWFNFYIGAKDVDFKDDGSQVTGRVFFKKNSGSIDGKNLKLSAVLCASLSDDEIFNPDSYSSLNDCFTAAKYASSLLIPDTEYYLWIFPNYTGYGAFTWSTWAGIDVVVDLSGGAGLAYINGEAYQLYIGNGTDWDLCMPYIGDGTDYVLYTG